MGQMSTHGSDLAERSRRKGTIGGTDGLYPQTPGVGEPVRRDKCSRQQHERMCKGLSKLRRRGKGHDKAKGFGMPIRRLGGEVHKKNGPQGGTGVMYNPLYTHIPHNPPYSLICMLRHRESWGRREGKREGGEFIMRHHQNL